MPTTLIRYPSYFDIHSILPDDMEETIFEKSLIHYASRLLGKGVYDEDDLAHALEKAITAVAAANLPANRHFKKVFICYGGEIKKDWLVSNLGLRLIMMNADVSNPIVARLQVEILSTH